MHSCIHAFTHSSSETTSFDDARHVARDAAPAARHVPRVHACVRRVGVSRRRRGVYHTTRCAHDFIIIIIITIIIIIIIIIKAQVTLVVVP